jgi:exopolyphosphatase/pppGpp-phosphohydrolase
MKICAVFDIGSGATKVMCCKFETLSKRVEEIFFQEEVEVHVKKDLQENGRLSENIEQQLVENVLELTEKAQKGCERRCEVFFGVATAAFRLAKNGAEVLARVADKTRVELRIVSQEEEGRRGFLTAQCLEHGGSGNILSFDSGGGSFQIAAQSLENESENLCYEGPWGSVSVWGALKNLKENAPVNPVSKEEFRNLIDVLVRKMPPKPSWMDGEKKVVAIGGPTSLFHMIEILTNDCKEMTSQKVEDLVLDKVLGKNSAELQLVDARLTQLELLVGKIALFLAICKHLEWPSDRVVYYRPCIGSCFGILLAEFALQKG